MSHRAAILTIAIAFSLPVAASTAEARDFCFNSSSATPSILVVAKDFKLPRKGKCKPIVGWDAGYYGFAFGRPASGTACLNTAGDALHVGVTIHATRTPGNADEQLQVYMDLPYPALTGGTVYLRQNLPVLILNRSDGFAADCGYTIPIP